MSRGGVSFREANHAIQQFMADLIINLPTGRANAISLRALADRMAVPVADRRWRFTKTKPGLSTVREWIRAAQQQGHDVLSSPRAGVWIAADDGEGLDVIEELRGQVHALERRMAAINQGKCALRTCRAELPEKVVRRGGLYCCPEHRYRAAIERAS